MCLRLYFIVRRDVDFVLFRLWEHCFSVRDDGADACFRQVQIPRDFFRFARICRNSLFRSDMRFGSDIRKNELRNRRVPFPVVRYRVPWRAGGGERAFLRRCSASRDVRV